MKAQIKNYSEYEVVKALNKKNDCYVSTHFKRIYELNEEGKGDIGIKSKGKMSFLKNYCGYLKIQVSHKELTGVRKNDR